MQVGKFKRKSCLKTKKFNISNILLKIKKINIFKCFEVPLKR